MEKTNLPNATAVLVLGIVSILTCCCYGIVGLVFGIVALVLAQKDMKLYTANPELYKNFSNLNVGRILAIIGVVMSALYLFVTIYMYAVIGEAGMMEMMENLKLKMEQQQLDN
ncbi:MAG: CCC motif membrane protein [Flavobacterium sp.]